jgi:hypothetical protein
MIIAAIAEGWVTLLVFYGFLCGVVLGSTFTYRIMVHDRT